jgi:hypothetical protein
VVSRPLISAPSLIGSRNLAKSLVFCLYLGEVFCKDYSYRTERSYTDWVRRFILFHIKKHPPKLGEPEIEAFLTH